MPTRAWGRQPVRCWFGLFSFDGEGDVGAGGVGIVIWPLISAIVGEVWADRVDGVAKIGFFIFDGEAVEGVEGDGFEIVGDQVRLRFRGVGRGGRSGSVRGRGRCGRFEVGRGCVGRFRRRGQ